MFDSNDTRNWQILGYTVTILVSDVIAVLMDPSNKGAPLCVGADAGQIILSQARLYSRRLPRTQEDEDNMVEATITQVMHAQI